MFQLILRCRTITPMFMAGADGRTPELRPSEFKGMMRWWWRAIKAEDDIKKLKKEEARIFGGAEEGEGRSKVKLLIKPLDIPDDYIGNNLKDLIGDDVGIRYLLYSTILPGRERLYIKPGFEFDIVLTSTDEISFKSGVASLWLAITFGGFGSRARRGGGNIEVLEIRGNEEILKSPLENLSFRCDEPETLAYWLIENTKRVSLIVNWRVQPENFCFSYSNLSFSRFIIAKEAKSTWREALADIGTIYMDFRTRHKSRIFEVGAFGLPVIHRKSQTLRPKNLGRRASPLIIKILHSNQKYYWIVLRLAGEFLPEGEVVAEFEGKGERESQRVDYAIIDDFWHILKKSGEEFILIKPCILDNIVRRLKSEKECRVLFFGSRARGDAHKNSDIDLAIETDEPIGDLEFEAPIDLVNLKRVNHQLRQKIEKEGIEIK